MEAILGSSGLGLESVVKVEIFLKDMEDFQPMNEVYANYFVQDTKPARYVVQAARLPKDVRIEIACTAFQSSE